MQAAHTRVLQRTRSPTYQLDGPCLVRACPLHDRLLHGQRCGLELGSAHVKEVLGHHKLQDFAADVAGACGRGTQWRRAPR